MLLLNVEEDVLVEINVKLVPLVKSIVVKRTVNTSVKKSLKVNARSAAMMEIVHAMMLIVEVLFSSYHILLYIFHFSGNRGSGRGGVDRRPRTEEVNRREEDAATVEVDDKPEAARRSTRGRGRGNNRGIRREDHRDRTGMNGQSKKEGFGKGNWGTDQDELKGETEPLPVDTTDVQKPVEDENADKNDSGVEVEKEDEKPIGMTLSEWKEKNKALEPESFNVRMPNDDKKLNLAPLKKTDDGEKDLEEFVVLVSF